VDLYTVSKLLSHRDIAATQIYAKIIDKKKEEAVYDGEYCIFHSKDIEGKKKKFDDEFWKEFERQKVHEKEYDFTGFVFPTETSFKRKTFEKAVFFGWAKFSEKVDFVHTQFSGKVYFREVKFFGIVNFGEVHFSGRTNFYGATFSGEILYGLFTSLRNRGIKRILKGRYKKIDFRFHLGERIAKEYPIIDRMTKDAWYLGDFKANHPIIYWIWWIFADCGRSFLRWALWSIFLVFFFAAIFFSLGKEAFSITNLKFSFETMLYYSVVTFTTLGFGDITPQTIEASRWVMAEVIAGYIMLGGLISILANKLARRS